MPHLFSQFEIDLTLIQLADRVKVRVVAVNLDERKIDFELAE